MEDKTQYEDTGLEQENHPVQTEKKEMTDEKDENASRSFASEEQTVVSETDSNMQDDSYLRENMYDKISQNQQGGSYDPNSQYQQGSSYDLNGQYQQGSNYDPNVQYQQSGSYDPNVQYQQSGSYDPNGQYRQTDSYQQNGQYQQGNSYDQGNQYRQGQNQQNGPYQQYRSNDRYQQYQKTDDKAYSTGFGIASMILGILSLMLFCTCVNIPLAVAAVIFGILQYSKGPQGKGMALTGMITAVLSIIALIATIALMWAPFMQYYREAKEYYREEQPEYDYDFDYDYDDGFENFFDFFDERDKFY